MIVATAGHVDHGKTTLVKALTGVDTDRLAEEKKRGLTIDLGFAYERDASDRVLGFVDVPGHERFIRNMLAGVSSIDFALLVVAADDGPMPQTLEHLAILDLLDIPAGAVALTKIDRVDESRRAQVSAEIQVLLKDTTLEGAPLFPVSGATGDGIAALKSALFSELAETRARRTAGRFRFSIDRSFTLSGAGRVVTGAVIAGTVRVGDQLHLSPGDIPVRVRGLHVHDREASEGSVGERVALNLAGAGLRRAEIARGDWLLDEKLHAPQRRLDVALRLLRSEAQNLKHWTPVHVHLGAVDVTGRVALLEAPVLAPGGQALAQLVLQDAVPALYGDRFILRDQSAMRTLGGGTVIDPFPPAKGRAKPDRLAQLRVLQDGGSEAAAAEMLRLCRDGFDFGAFSRARNLTAAAETALFDSLAMVSIRLGGGNRVLSRERIEELEQHISSVLGARHEADPESIGPTETELARDTADRMSRRLMSAILGALIQKGAVVRDGIRLRLASHTPRLNEEDARLWEEIVEYLEEGGVRPPRIREVAAALDLPLEKTTALMDAAARRGQLMRVAPNRYFPLAAIRQLAEMAEKIAAETDDGAFTARVYKDQTGIGRNVAIEVLEFFDSQGFTRRRGEARSIERPANEAFGAA